MITKNVTAIAKVAITSLIGTSKKRPVSWGNYFENVEGYRFVNMWAENLKHLRQTGVIDNGIIVTLYRQDHKKWAFVTDKRVPKDFLYDGVCFTGYCTPPLEYIEDMFSQISNKEGLLEYTDPVLYYKNRGQIYKDYGNGIISVEKDPDYISTKPKLNQKWTVEVLPAIQILGEDASRRDE